MSTISPEGYKITRDPVNNNPFWEIEIDGAHIKSLTCSKTTEDQYDYYNWSYVDELDESHHIITQKVSNAAGITFTPSVSPEGVISWTNDGDLPNPSPVNIKGLKGDTGNTGATGATPNITMTATADATASLTPTVVVTKTGTAENPSYAFAFSGLKGEQGPRGVQGADGSPGEQGLPGVDGVTPVVSAQATVSQTTGVPSVTVTKTGSDAAPVFTFAFDNIKGETGAQGEKGDPGDVGAMPVITATASVDSNVGTPAVVVTKSGTAAAPNLAFAFSNIKGATGEKGDKGDPGEDGMGTVAVGTTTTGAAGTQASVVNSGTAQNAILDFTIPQGAQGVQGVAGQDGDDGFSPIVTVTDHTTYHHIEIQDAVHTEQFDVYDGADGQQGPAGQGVPTGGTAGQVLAKKTGTDYDTEWVTPSAGGGGAPTRSYTSRAVPFSNSKSGSSSGSYSEFSMDSTVGIWIDASGKVLFDANPGYDYSSSGCRSLYIPLFKESNNTLKGTGMLISTFANSSGHVCVAYVELLATITFSGSSVTISLSLQPAQSGGSTGLIIKDVYGTPTYSADLSLWNGSVYVYACNS